MSDVTDLTRLREYKDGQATRRSFDAGKAREALRFLRVSKLRAPRLASDAGYPLLKNHFSSVPEVEVYEVAEQVVLALLDVSRRAHASELIDMLTVKFGKDSVRVQRLKAMLYECDSTFSQANEIYTSILEKYPADAMTMKRQITILKSKGHYIQAITMLNTYLQIFGNDFEAWMELASLHIKLLSLKHAAFCYEELILTAPINYIFYVKYAEISYSIGGAENYIIALKYFTHSLELNSPRENTSHPPTNLTAIYGIIMSIYSFCNAPGGGVSKLRDSQTKVYEWAVAELRAITARDSPQKLSLVSAFINSTSIAKHNGDSQ
eukprot:gene16877-20067_t